MSNPAKSAFVGYTYQSLVAMLAVFLLEQGIYSLEEVKAEITIEGKSFDDLLLIRSGNKKDIYIQVKNTQKNIINFKNNEVFFNGSKMTLNKNSINVIITENTNNLTTNCSDKNFSYFKDESLNLIVINLTSENIIGYIYNNYSLSRINQLMLLVADSFTDYFNCRVNKSDIPKKKFISTDLVENTILVRNFKVEPKKVLFIVGKPGVGKSHLVNEIKVKENRLYRFWISSQDPHRSQRLMYNTFLEEVTFKIFGSGKLKTEDEIIDKISNLEEVFYIDGLDHVANYAKHEIEKYMKFIEKVFNSKTGKLIILTRPLEFDIKYPKVVLADWSFDETREYLFERGIKNYSVAIKIYDISKGYPIITSYLASEYLKTNKLNYETTLDNINDYYETILKNVIFKDKLNIFTFTTSFITYKELKEILTYSNKGMIEFINNYPFLFEIRDDRISLFHDSFNNFISFQIEEDYKLKKHFQTIIKKSLRNFDHRYMSRVLSYNLDSVFLSEILHKYNKLEVFLNLKNNIIDFESIRQFYFSLRKIYSRDDIKLFSIEQAYEFSMILILLMRDHIEQSYGLMYQLYVYFKNNDIDWKDQIFSTKAMYQAFSFFSGNDMESLIKLETNKGYGEENVERSLRKQIYKEVNFFKNFKIDNYNFIKNIVENDDWAIAKDYLTNLLVMSFIYDHNEDGLKSIVNMFLDKKYETARYMLKRYLQKIGWKYITGFDSLSLYEAVKIIKQLGTTIIKNDYNSLTLKEIIFQNAIKGSFEMHDTVTGYIRLANNRERKIDIYSLAYYFTMYYERKDYSVLGLSEISYELITRDLISLEYAFDIINAFQEMSEKGIRHLANKLVNLLGENYVAKLEELGILSIHNNRYIWLAALSTNIINNASEKYIKSEINSIINNKVNLQSRSSTELEFEASDYQNILLSKYSDYFKEQIKLYGFKLFYKTEKPLNEEEAINKVTLNYEKRNPKENLNNGYVVFEDREYYKKIKLDYLEFARYGGIRGEKLPHPNFLDLYDKDVLKRDIEKILQHVISKSYYGDKYSDERIESHGDRGLMSGLPKLYSYLNLDVDWVMIRDLFVKTINTMLLIND